MPDALELLLTGDSIDAAHAKGVGLAWRVHPHDDLLIEARSLAGRLCQGAPLAVRATNEMAHRGQDLPWTDAVRMGEALRRVVSTSDDTVEGRNAWREKRPPEWKAR
jgi:enoyl-CoA hydratase/carnithine racemase